VGPVPARHIGHRMYRGEFYYLQSDAHVSYSNRWEMSLIQELESTGNEMAVLSTYLSDFVGSIDENGEAVRVYRPVMCVEYWQEWNGLHHLHHSTQPETSPAVKGTPQLHPWFGAGFAFRSVWVHAFGSRLRCISSRSSSNLLASYLFSVGAISWSTCRTTIISQWCSVARR
jgi:Glycosyltransferase (GlcNAc)